MLAWLGRQEVYLRNAERKEGCSAIPVVSRLSAQFCAGGWHFSRSAISKSAATTGMQCSSAELWSISSLLWPSHQEKRLRRKGFPLAGSLSLSHLFIRPKLNCAGIAGMARATGDGIGHVQIVWYRERVMLPPPPPSISPFRYSASEVPFGLRPASGWERHLARPSSILRACSPPIGPIPFPSHPNELRPFFILHLQRTDRPKEGLKRKVRMRGGGGGK